MTIHIELQPIDNTRLANLCGQFDEHLKKIEQHLAVEISNRGHNFRISGDDKDIELAQVLLETLYKETETTALDREKVHLFLQQSSLEERVESLHKADANVDKEIIIHTGRGTIKPRGKNQYRYLKRISEQDINFEIGRASCRERV